MSSFRHSKQQNNSNKPLSMFGEGTHCPSHKQMKAAPKSVRSSARNDSSVLSLHQKPTVLPTLCCARTKAHIEYCCMILLL